MENMDYNEGKILPVNIHDEVKTSFMDYAMSVIVSRALPDVRDGLKPVHRRILYAMSDMGMTPDKTHKKSARLVGEVLGKYHPHGDLAVYEALVRLAQDFSTRYMLIDGHGNFGSQDGDPPAAMRYTEARLSKISMELLADLHKDTVDFRSNFDDTLEEPEVLPSRIPNLLINGSSGIAVGMATNIPPHNISEVIDAIVYLIDDPEATLENIMQYIKGPDFPTGGLILGQNGIKEAYTTGRGIIKIKGKTEIIKVKEGKSRIVITEIPYMQNKAKLIERIADLAREKRIEGISGLRDESDRSGVRVVLEIRKEYNPQIILNQLFKFTPLQQTFGIIMLALVRGEPKIMNLKEALTYYLDYQKEVITRRTQFDLRKAEERAHIVEGLKTALDHLDEVITLIRQSNTTEIARRGLMDKFELSEKQAQAILDMRLQRLTGLERKKLLEEHEELLERISYLKKVLDDEKMIYDIIKEEILNIKKRYGDQRLTQIAPDEEDFEYVDLIPDEDMVITLTRQGYIKRLPITIYRKQKRGGRGISSIQMRNNDFVEHMFISSAHHLLLCFSNHGKVYLLKVYEIPELGRQARGTSLNNLLPLSEGEFVTAVISTKDFETDYNLIMVTAHGYIKKTPLKDYRNTHRNGINALKLEKNDELIGVRHTTGKGEIILGTAKGLVICFKEEEVRSMGRVTRGVRGILLSEDDLLVGMGLADRDNLLLIITEKGLGKYVSVNEFKPQGRGGKGKIAIKLSERSGKVVSFKIVRKKGDLFIITAKGIVIREQLNEIPTQRRYARGVTLIRLEEGDRVVAAAQVKK